MLNMSTENSIETLKKNLETAIEAAQKEPDNIPVRTVFLEIRKQFHRVIIEKEINERDPIIFDTFEKDRELFEKIRKEVTNFNTEQKLAVQKKDTEKPPRKDREVRRIRFPQTIDRIVIGKVNTALTYLRDKPRGDFYQEKKEVKKSLDHLSALIGFVRAINTDHEKLRALKEKYQPKNREDQENKNLIARIERCEQFIDAFGSDIEELVNDDVKRCDRLEWIALARRIGENQWHLL